MNNNMNMMGPMNMNIMMMGNNFNKNWGFNQNYHNQNNHNLNEKRESSSNLASVDDGKNSNRGNKSS